MKIQEEVRLRNIKLGWSYILDYENSKNSFRERREQIIDWKKYAAHDIQESTEVIAIANSSNQVGIRKIDALQVACEIVLKCD